MRFARIDKGSVIEVVEAKGFEYITHLTKYARFVKIPENLEKTVEAGWKFNGETFSKEAA